jgi:PKD repeat protein
MPRQILVLVLSAALGGLIFLIPGCDELVTQTIETTTAGNPTAEFGISPDSGCIPLLVRFDDASSGPIARWIWNFGDGFYDTILADSGDVSHTYTLPGSYTVTLSVFDTIDGSDAETKKRAVIVGHNVDSVTLSDTLGCPGEEYTFTAHNPYGISTWRWTFGDGTPALTDSSLVQTHVYDEPGVYEFKLIVTGECGQKTLIDTVHILNCATPSFTADPVEGCAPLVVTFVDQSRPAIDSSVSPPDTTVIVDWLWNFGNGTTLHEQGDAIEVTYASAGSYPVRLTVTTLSGGVTSYVDTIVVHSSTAPFFSAVPTSACQVANRQFLVQFTRTAALDTAWFWDFGDGDTSEAQSPIHAYTTPGKYTVKLIAYGACGADSAVTVIPNMITYYDHLVSKSFSYSQAQPIDSPYVITFIDQSPPAVVLTRHWDFGVAPFPDTDTVVRTFLTSATFTTRLTRYNDCDSIWADSQIVIQPLIQPLTK